MTDYMQNMASDGTCSTHKENGKYTLSIKWEREDTIEVLYQFAKQKCKD